jgi:hypothetical protein
VILIDPILSSTVLILTPIYLFLMIYFLRRYSKRKYGNAEIGKYYVPASYLRVVGCFLTGVMYKYFYRIGDTLRFYRGTEDIWSLFMDDA